jgi:hypothetical protein
MILCCATSATDWQAACYGPTAGGVVMDRSRWLLTGLACALPLVMGAKGGCMYNSKEAAPVVAGTWALTYDDRMEVDVTIGGAVYHQSLPSGGGAFTVNHNGTPFSFHVDCARPDVICPSEVWPAQVSIDQRDPTYQHRMWVQIPVQACSGQLVAPKAGECGAGTSNPDCDPVCTGTITTKSAEAFGLINSAGDAFDLFLGGGVATNGVSCALLGISAAHATLVNTGAAATDDWTTQAMRDGVVKTAYAGACLFAGDVIMDGQLEALALGATVEVRTKFSASRVTR